MRPEEQPSRPDPPAVFEGPEWAGGVDRIPDVTSGTSDSPTGGEPAEEEAAGSEPPADSSRTVMRNSAVMATGSILSRATGILRDVALVAALGTYVTADLFTIGNSLPDIVYVLIIGGALNAVFVPQLVRRMRDDADGGRGYTDSLLSVTGIALVVLTVVAVLAAPLIVRVYATNAYSDQQLDLAIAFARYCLPQIFFFGLYTMLAQVLNARGHFGMPMFAPIFNNIVAITTYLSFALVVGPTAAASGDLTAGQTAWLGVGTTLGIIAQSCVLIPVLIRSGYRWRFTRRWRGMGLGRAGRLAGWVIGLVAVTQVGFIVASRLATTANVTAQELGLPETGLAAYTKGYLVFMIPHGIVTVSIVTAQLPGLSRTIHSGRMREAGHLVGHSMRLIAVIIAPIALSLWAGSQALSAFLFDVGANTPEQASQLGTVIEAYMLGLLPFTLYYVLQRGWYAKEDSRTPFLLAALMNAVYIAAAISLFNLVSPGPSQVNALAVAYSLANWVLFLVAWPALRRTYGHLDVRRTLVTLVKVGLAGAFSQLTYLVVGWLIPFHMELGGSRMEAFVDLAVTATIFLVSFGLAAWVLRVEELRELTSMVISRLPGGKRRVGS